MLICIFIHTLVMELKNIVAIIAVVLALTITITVQTVYATTPGPQQNSAKEFAPGQIAANSGGEITANDIAPGHLIPPGPANLRAEDFAPGHEKQTTTCSTCG
jgi:hypothetical protein